MKLVALDLDGTLLNRDGTISKETIAEMDRLVKRGCLIAIATGRPYQTTLQLLAQNGLEPATGYPQVLICDERDIFYLESGRYQPESPWNENAYQYERSLLDVSRQVVTHVSMERRSEFLINNPYMQNDRGYVEIFYWSRELAEESFPVFAEALDGQPVKPVRNNRLIAFRSREVGKGLMLQKVADKLGLKADEILAMGDSHNDLCMLERFQAATTDNADDEIKRAVRAKRGTIAGAAFSLGVAEVLSALQ